jgi:hypothetical protein
MKKFIFVLIVTPTCRVESVRTIQILLAAIGLKSINLEEPNKLCYQ